VSKTRYITVKLTEYEACEITSTMLAWGYQRPTNRIVSKIHKALQELGNQQAKVIKP
jgi:hypothetical protein